MRLNAAKGMGRLIVGTSMNPMTYRKIQSRKSNPQPFGNKGFVLVVTLSLIGIINRLIGSFSLQFPISLPQNPLSHLPPLPSKGRPCFSIHSHSTAQSSIHKSNHSNL